MSKFVAFLKNDSGATAIEYGLIAAGISLAIIAVVFGLGSGLNTTFTSVTTALNLRPVPAGLHVAAGDDSFLLADNTARAPPISGCRGSRAR